MPGYIHVVLGHSPMCHARPVETGERMLLWCSGRCGHGRGRRFPPPIELAADGGIYVLVDDGPAEDWRYEFVQRLLDPAVEGGQRRDYRAPISDYSQARRSVTRPSYSLRTVPMPVERSRARGRTGATPQCSRTRLRDAGGRAG